MLIDLVNSEAYSQATSQWLDTYLTVSQPFQRVLETTMTQVLTRLNMSLRSEMTSLAQRLTNVEMRLDDMDAKLDDIQRAIQALAASIHTANAAEAKEIHQCSPHPSPRSQPRSRANCGRLRRTPVPCYG